MDNITHAIFLAFTMFALVIGLSYSLYLLNNMNSVSTTLIHATDSTASYKSISYTGNNDNISSRIVGVDTVISTLYKYRQESFSVEIYSGIDNLDQVFDMTIENVIASGNTEDDEYKAYTSLYKMSEAPWIVSPEATKQRVDMYIGSKKGYINGKKVDYSNGGLQSMIKNKENPTFEEQFIQYTYDGETFSDNQGDDIESITGSIRAQNKIIIRYILQQ